MKKYIPNVFTQFNLFAGCVGVYACATNHYKLVPICIVLSLVFDFIDGLSARLLQVKSELGAQLDSLADMVSFGVLPGMMLLQLIGMSNMGMGGESFLLNPIAYLGFIFTVFASLRLAKFNIDTRQSESFLGLATPAATIFVLGLYLHFFQQNFLNLPTFGYKVIYQIPSLLAITAILSLLMVSEIPMFSFKGDILKSPIKIGFVILSLIILLLFREIGMSIAVIFYIFASFIESGHKKALLSK
ncbi:MAG: CDP-alcohol phosphatidyltransferase family protein [Chitinophagales bacterium]|nr:CDP-alcohol phosphatidyltransferase family protein [Chitinophagales bacterium]